MTFFQAVIALLEQLPSWVWTVSAVSFALYFFIITFRYFIFFSGGFDPYEEPLIPPDPPPPDVPLKWQVKVADVLCWWRWGFELMYCLGWAVEGRHFTSPCLDPDQDPD